MRVLVVEDDHDFAASLIDVLEINGHEAVHSSTESAAREAVSEHDAFDVAVLDVNLGSENSIGLLRDLRQQRPSLRVVAITGGGRLQPAIGLPLAEAHGADAVLFKPFSNSELLSALTGS